MVYKRCRAFPVGVFIGNLNDVVVPSLSDGLIHWNANENKGDRYVTFLHPAPNAQRREDALAHNDKPGRKDSPHDNGNVNARHMVP